MFSGFSKAAFSKTSFSPNAFAFDMTPVSLVAQPFDADDDQTYERIIRSRKRHFIQRQNAALLNVVAAFVASGALDG